MRGHECGVELFILMLSNSFLPPHEYSLSLPVSPLCYPVLKSHKR